MGANNFVIPPPSTLTKVRPPLGTGIAALEAASDIILACDSFEKLVSAVHMLRDMLGLENIVFHGVTLPGTSPMEPRLILTYDPAWVAHYTNHNYFAIDPIVLAAGRSPAPLDWADVRKSDPRVIRLFSEARRYGVGRQGVTVPIRGVGGELSLITATSESDDADWRQYRKATLRVLIEIGQYLHAQVKRIGGLCTSEHPDLSKRELQCLQLIAFGHVAKEISASLELSEGAVRLYLSSAKHKLNSATLHQAIGRAAILGLISA